MKTKRLFTAITLPDNIKDEIVKESEKYKDLPGKFVKREDLHITLLFMGNVKENDIDNVKVSLNEVQKHVQSFNVSLTKIGFAPPNSRVPRMIWVYVENNNNLQKLHDSIVDELDKNKISYHKEDREYYPHINLARLKTFELRNLTEEEIFSYEPVDINLSFEVKDFSLIESKLTRQGPIYKIIHKVKLK